MHLCVCVCELNACVCVPCQECEVYSTCVHAFMRECSLCVYMTCVLVCRHVQVGTFQLQSISHVL